MGYIIDSIDNFNSNGGQPTLGSSAYTRLNYLGVFPGNLENWSTTFAAAVVNATPLAYYTIRAYDTIGNSTLSEIYTIKIIIIMFCLKILNVIFTSFNLLSYFCNFITYH